MWRSRHVLIAHHVKTHAGRTGPAMYVSGPASQIAPHQAAAWRQGVLRIAQLCRRARGRDLEMVCVGNRDIERIAHDVDRARRGRRRNQRKTVDGGRGVVGFHEHGVFGSGGEALLHGGSQAEQVRGREAVRVLPGAAYIVGNKVVGQAVTAQFVNRNRVLRRFGPAEQVRQERPQPSIARFWVGREPTNSRQGIVSPC